VHIDKNFAVNVPVITSNASSCYSRFFCLNTFPKPITSQRFLYVDVKFKSREFKSLVSLFFSFFLRGFGRSLGPFLNIERTELVGILDFAWHSLSHIRKEKRQAEL